MIYNQATAIDVSANDYPTSGNSSRPFVVHVGTAGNIAVRPFSQDATLTIKCAAGTTIALACQKVLNSGTTASDLVIFYS